MNIYSTLVKVSDAHKVTLGNDYFIIKKKTFILSIVLSKTVTVTVLVLSMGISMWDTLQRQTG